MFEKILLINSFIVLVIGCIIPGKPFIKVGVEGKVPKVD